MYSQYWNTARGHRLDYRRYTVVEGETPLPLGSTYRRKRLRSAGEEDDEEARRSCTSRPNPEGSLSAGELSRYGKPEEEEEEELQRLCQRCHIMASQLNRQAAALADTTALKALICSLCSGQNTNRTPLMLVSVARTDSELWTRPAHPFLSGSAAMLKDLAYTSFLFEKLQRLQWPRRIRHASIDAHCDICGASFQQLRRLALRRALGVSREMAPRPATPSVPTPTTTTCDPLAPEGGWVGDELPLKQQRWSYEEQQQGGGAAWRWGGVQSTYLGGGGAKSLATVTPPPERTPLPGGSMESVLLQT
ncbi:kinesin-like protein KIF26A [Lates japonicus]|uniref:Kinesin-like protein KIF26A n=1 Tax=Lates japonicus TaxID=270547 RepID=A0AAD3R6G9_LATJO|nr:kinesin-like protein KIF26A [Lates japonicus]